MTQWLLLPDVTAPGVDRRTKATYRISPEFVKKSAIINRATPVMQLWAHVVGQLPPINNISRLAAAAPTPTLTTLHDSVALYQGLKRPHDNEHDGDSVLIYVVNPKVTVAYQADIVCVARAVTLPKNKIIPVGFKLKGFKHVFDTHLKSLFELNDKQFLSLATAIEAICTEIGDELFADDGRTRAYKAAHKLAANDNVRLHGSEIRRAA